MRILTTSELHRSAVLYAQLVKAVATHRPDVVAVVGDFLDAADDFTGKLSVEECATVMSELKCPEVIFTRGNHEDSALWAFREHYRQGGREFVLLNGSAMTIGPLVVIGFPCLLGSGDGCFDEVPNDPERWLPQLARIHGPASRTLWLMHEPPVGTSLSSRSGYHAGNPEWREAIERFIPRLVVFGHDHETPVRTGRWHEAIGSTLCLNCGQSRDVLRYLLIDLDFPAATPSVASAIRVVACPARQTTRWP